ncbi:MAG TPA: hypothetical protein VF765_02065 [Polyangiaceae bacterium]
MNVRVKFGQGFYKALCFCDNVSKLEKNLKERLLQTLKESFSEWKAYYINSGFKDLEQDPRNCGDAMRDLRKEIEACNKDIEQAFKTKKQVLGGKAVGVAKAVGKSVGENAGKHLVLGTATAGISIAVDAAKKALPGMLELLGIALSEKKQLVAYYADKGTADAALLDAAAEALILKAEEYERAAGDLKFKKRRSRLHTQKETSLSHERRRLEQERNKFQDNMEKLLEDNPNIEHMPLMGGAKSDSDSL